MNLKIYPPEGILEAEVAMPLSKSVSNRALVISALAGEKMPRQQLADCVDIDVMAGAVDQVDGEIDCCESGTAMRFLTAFFAAKEGADVTLTGSDRLRQRPLGVLVDALRELGADISWLGEEGYLPIKIVGRRLHCGRLKVDSSQSSQYVSALLLIAPTLEGGLDIELTDDPVSLPYIDLTLSMMQRSGIDCDREHLSIHVSEGRYDASRLQPEGDWSSAAFWLAIEAASGGFMTLKNLSIDSRQPDRRALDLFGRLGAVVSDDPDDDIDDGVVLTGSPDVAPRLEVDLSATPDLFPAVAVTCALIGVPFRLTGLGTLALKESDRLKAMHMELAKIGLQTEVEKESALIWSGVRMPLFEVPEFETYNDHRMAMSLAAVAVYVPGITIKGAECVAKSYPGFWDDLQKAGFIVESFDEQPTSEE
ncbi:MAG: 3-phosphoshikimate 1-carboxyvinyltransferase [Bacteroides sp.]|nr:3-phosphoshikimate 1-carboxyvinyltransferase [Bacteroides sp.]MCM1413577.1 3-phosphoshikimate 1-carboxyvinyltransferase [Bacteroides sp.]MCM1471131.1 3-phosphoshikimate 1-carboxyvinyltransferase [Bacteroides sp.]